MKTDYNGKVFIRPITISIYKLYRSFKFKLPLIGDILMDDIFSDLEIADSILLDQIKILSRKINEGEVDDPVEEDVEIKQLETLVNLISIHFKIMEAKRIGDMEHQIEISDEMSSNLKRSDNTAKTSSHL